MHIDYTEYNTYNITNAVDERSPNCVHTALSKEKHTKRCPGQQGQNIMPMQVWQHFPNVFEHWFIHKLMSIMPTNTNHTLNMFEAPSLHPSSGSPVKTLLAVQDADSFQHYHYTWAEKPTPPPTNGLQWGVCVLCSAEPSNTKKITTREALKPGNTLTFITCETLIAPYPIELNSLSASMIAAIIWSSSTDLGIFETINSCRLQKVLWSQVNQMPSNPWRHGGNILSCKSSEEKKIKEDTPFTHGLKLEIDRNWYDLHNLHQAAHCQMVVSHKPFRRAGRPRTKNLLPGCNLPQLPKQPKPKKKTDIQNIQNLQTILFGRWYVGPRDQSLRRSQAPCSTPERMSPFRPGRKRQSFSPSTTPSCCTHHCEGFASIHKIFGQAKIHQLQISLWI